MKLKEWCQDIYLKAVVPNSNFPYEYAKEDASIRETISDFTGVKTDFHSDLGIKSQSELRIALILSDFTSVFPDTGTKAKIVVASDETPFIPRTISAPNKFLEQLQEHEGEPIFNSGFFYCDDKQVQDFLRQVEPLAQAGRLMIRPMPIVFGLTKDLTPEGNRIWKAVKVEPNTPGETWFVSEAEELEQSQNALPLKEGSADPNLEIKMCSFALPYLDNVSFEQLSEILDGEEDSLSGFRTSVRQMLSEVRKEPSMSTDILNDVVRPATDKIERRFRSITNIHRLKIAGVTVSTATLSLLALTNAGLGAALASVLGASGLGLITKEYSDYLKEMADLKEMPFYLLWRLRQKHKR